MLCKKILLITIVTTVLFASPIVLAADEILCDGLTYNQILARQYDTEGRLIGTRFDGCRNTKGVILGSYYRAGGAPTQQAIEYLNSDNYVLVSQENIGDQYWWAFLPKNINGNMIKNAVMFVPGANVDAASYSPLAYNLVKNLSSVLGDTPTMVIITRYPVKNPNNIYLPPCNVLDDDIVMKTVRTAHKSYSYGTNNSHNIKIDNWVLGGHSEGGEGMAEYLHLLAKTKNGLTENGIKGAFWLASYPASPAAYIPDDFCSLGIAGGDDLGLDKDTWDANKTNGNFPPNTIYFDYENGFEHGIHSYLGSYCSLTPDPNPLTQFEVLSGELEYYEVQPDSEYPLSITRQQQDRLIFGSSNNPEDVGHVGRFVYQTLNSKRNNLGQPLCQLPFKDIYNGHSHSIGFNNGNDNGGSGHSHGTGNVTDHSHDNGNQ